jgi:hypothetical protein
MADNSYSRDASGRLCFEMFRIPGDMYLALRDELVREFQLVPLGDLIEGFSEVFQDFGRGDEIVGLEWDTWSGFIVVAKTPESESLVHRIRDYLVESRWANFTQ